LKELLISILTNGVFITTATLFIKHFQSRNLQKQKNQLEKEIEQLKSDLLFETAVEQEKLNKKREIYVNLVDSMAIFIGFRVEESERIEYQKKFLKAYDTVWLWGSDEVLKALSNYMELKTNNVSGDLEKEAFAQCIIAMRKDIGFSETTITETNYKFVIF